MKEADLPSPKIGSNGYHLRRVAVRNISALQVIAGRFQQGVHPDAAALRDFFLACAAAVLATSGGGGIPANALTSPVDGRLLTRPGDSGIILTRKVI